MSEDFKKKLQDYAEGKLNQEERAELEQEFEKLEEYQLFIEDQLTDDNAPKLLTDIASSGLYTPKKESFILKKAKWKARLQNALTAVGIVLLVTILCGILSSFYYCSGKPSRMTIYNDVVSSTIAVTEPNLELRSGGTSVKLFGLEIKKDLEKQIGKAQTRAGEMKVSFLFNKASYPERKWLLDQNRSKPFYVSQYGERESSNSTWQTLEKLPEGTVAEAFIYLDQPYSTAEVLKKLKNKEMLPVWFAVDTGGASDPEHARTPPIGFPYQPMWHEKDMTIGQHTEQKGALFSKVVSESASSPTVESYGSADLRNKNFLDTLKLLKNYEKIANTITGPHLQLKERIDYLDQHGVKIYGIVVTGPSKEILKLKNENWVTGMELGEVRLWNWD